MYCVLIKYVKMLFNLQCGQIFVLILYINYVLTGRLLAQNLVDKPCFSQYFVEAPLAAITPASLLGYDAISLAHLYLGSFSHSSLQILKLCQIGWGASLHSYFQGDVQSGSSPGSGWATQGHSETCPQATPALSWLCAKGRCPVGR